MISRLRKNIFFKNVLPKLIAVSFFVRIEELKFLTIRPSVQLREQVDSIFIAHLTLFYVVTRIGKNE
jgi:hypothetical protein